MSIADQSGGSWGSYPTQIAKRVYSGIQDSLRSKDPSARERVILESAGYDVKNTGPRGAPVYTDPSGKRISGTEAARAADRIKAGADFEDLLSRDVGAKQPKQPKLPKKTPRIPKIPGGGVLTGWVIGSDLLNRVEDILEQEPIDVKRTPPRDVPAPTGDFYEERNDREQELLREREAELSKRERQQLERELDELRRQQELDRKRAESTPRDVSVPILSPVSIYTEKMPLPAPSSAPTASPGGAPTPASTVTSYARTLFQKYGAVALPSLMALAGPKKKKKKKKRGASQPETDLAGFQAAQLGFTTFASPYLGAEASLIGGFGDGGGKEPCECKKPPRKKKRRKARSVCYSGRYIQRRFGQSKTKLRKVPCR